MTDTRVEAIARAVLYEGYVLYPYRASAQKNRHRWSPGNLAPGFAFRAECLAVGEPDARLTVRVRFLLPLLRTGGGRPPTHEAAEREVECPALTLAELSEPRSVPFEFPPALELDGETERLQHALAGTVVVSAVTVTERVFRVSVRVENCTTTEPETEALRTLLSAHLVLRLRGGEFVSMADPPTELRTAAAGCHNDGVWPVLVGEPGTRDTLLASPIILPDYPQIAPESCGDFCDGTEIDEMLALRVLTLTDAEKHEVAADPHTRAILERVERLSPDSLGGLHGAIRSLGSERRPAPGERVRLCPRGRADAFDMLLTGTLATVVSVDTDFEGTVYFAVVLDNDPGQDLGHAGRPGHRFYFRVDEVVLHDGDQP